MSDEIQYVQELGSTALSAEVESLSTEAVYAGVFAYLKEKWDVDNLPLSPIMPVKGKGTGVTLRGGKSQQEEHRGKITFFFDITARSNDAAGFPFALTKFALECVGRNVTLTNGIVVSSIALDQELEIQFQNHDENGEITGTFCLEVAVDLTRSSRPGNVNGTNCPELIDSATIGQALMSFRLQVAMAALCEAFSSRFAGELSALPEITTRIQSEYYDTLALRLLECTCSRISGQVSCQVEFRGNSDNEAVIFSFLDQLRASLPWNGWEQTLSGGSKVYVAVIQEAGATTIRHGERFGMPVLQFRVVLNVVFDPVKSIFSSADEQRLFGEVPPLRQNPDVTMTELEQALALRLAGELNLPIDVQLKRGSRVHGVEAPPIPGGRIALRMMDAENHQCNSSCRFELFLYRLSREELLHDLTVLNGCYPALHPSLGGTRVGAVLKEKAVIVPVAERGKVVHRMRVIFTVKW